MEDVVTCPNCGESNPADVPYCQACQWQLRPLGEDRAGEEDSEPRRGPDALDATLEGEGALPDWLQASREERIDPGAGSGEKEDMAPASETPTPGEDFLSGLAQQNQPDDEEVPEWIATIMGMNADQEDLMANSTAYQDKAAANRSAEVVAEPLHSSTDDIESDSWPPGLPLATDDQNPPVDSSAPQAEATGSPRPDEDDEIYDWLRNLDSAADRDANVAVEPEPRSATTDVPTWVRRLDGIQGLPARPESPNPTESLPDWLKDSATGEDGSPIIRDEFPQTPDLLEWSTAAAPKGTEPDAQPEPESPVQAASPGSPQKAPAFAPEGLNGLDVDAVFASMEMPDWLADVGPGEVAASRQPPPAAQEEEPIAPAELPSWVQAMRPVESAITPSPDSEEQAQFEERGPLLGLHGVIPAVPGAAVPSSRTQAHSMRLEVSDQQKAHAAFLEQLLAAESLPIPLKANMQLRSQRSLRWAIGALLFLVLAASVFSGAKRFPLPAAVPNESIRAIDAVQRIAPDEPVLLAFDFEPATVGEMEATAASILDHLLLLKHPRLALISTSPTGSVLADRFMSTTLEARGYRRGIQYVSLGYLPGGLAGVRAFARDPVAAMPLGAGADRVWESGVLLGVTRLSDFAAIIVLTDGLESGRVWIEQTASDRGSGSLILVSSAQVGPMLLPYVDSGQVDGLVSGLNGAAGIEMANGGLPGFVRRYWDAYSLGLLAAVLFIALGGMWQFWLGLGERRLEQAG